jgi:hypothetical protein
MKKNLFTLLGFTMLGFSAMAQNGLKLHPCATYEAMEEGFKADPSLKARYEASQAQFELDYAAEINRVNTAAKVAVPAPVKFGLSLLPTTVVAPEATVTAAALARLVPPRQNIAHIATDTALPLYLIILNPVSLRIIFFFPNKIK